MANPNEDRGFNTIQNSSVEKREKNKTMQKYTLFTVVVLFALIVVMLLVMAVGGIIANVANSGNKGPDNEKVDWGTFTVTTTDTLHGDLVLVNNTHVYTFPANDEHLELLFNLFATHQPRIYQLSGLSSYMDRDALVALDAMLTDFYTATGKTDVLLKYAYRDYKEQEELSSSIQAGYSDHHTGLGIQLGYSKDGRTYALSTDETYNWLFENCHKYGFIIRYPADKVDLTGVEDYTDYFRYVGVAHATYMKEHTLCMEEYITLLHSYTNDKPLAINGADGNYYEVYYVAVDGSATVKYPTNYAYTVSGTNEGGVVVTVDRSEALKPEETSDSTADTSADTQ